ncbi:MAG: biopolymer transporter ExbD [Nitrospirota bacterium]
MTGNSSQRRQLMAEINIIPLVDVVLVLLIIFMVTAPMMDRGIDLSLPQTVTNTIAPEERHIITIEKNKKLTFNKEQLSLNDLSKQLASLKDESIYLLADKSVPYGTVVEVMDMIKKSGIERLGMVTEPLLQEGTTP